MKRNLRLATAAILAGTLCVMSFAPSLAQYTNPYIQNHGQSTYNQPNYGQNYMQPLQGRVVTVPVGQPITTVIQYPISSQLAQVGDRITLTLGADVYSGGALALPAGSQIEGQVVDVAKASRFINKVGRINIRFNSATTPNGQRIPLSAKIKSVNGVQANANGILYGGTALGTAADVAKSTAVGAGVGALSGLVGGAISGGKIGKTTAIATGIGGGIGMLGSKGDDVVIPANSQVDIVLDQPLTITPNY